LPLLGCGRSHRRFSFLEDGHKIAPQMGVAPR
jgi:hypothetical protein